MDTATKTITTGTYGHTYTVVDQRAGTNIVLSLLESGNLHIGLTDAGRTELAEMKQDPRSDTMPYADEEILFGLLGDEFLGNGWSFTPTLDTWGHMSGAPGISDDFTIEDDDTQTCERLWFLNDYGSARGLLDKLEANDLIFHWWGKFLSEVPEQPSPMRLY